MNAEIKKKWIEALRSGEYEQGRYRLRSTNECGHPKFDVFGVLCDLYAEAHPDERTWDYMHECFVDSEKPQHYYWYALPPKVQRWAEIANQNPLLKAGSLAVVNDEGYSFTQLADMIEREM